ncbi:MAG: hypothetical protein ACJ79S_02305 [Gemmatimonadaceae bacterium]
MASSWGFLGPGLTVAVTTAVLGQLMRAGRRSAATGADGTATLTYSPVLRYFGLAAGVALPLFLLLMMFKHPPKSAGDWYAFAGLIGGFSLLGWWLILTVARTRVLVSDGEVTAHGLWGAPTRLAWRDVVRVRYGRQSGYFTLEDASGRKVRASSMMVGLPNLVEAMRQRLPEPAYADAVRNWQSMARGYGA